MRLIQAALFDSAAFEGLESDQAALPMFGFLVLFAGVSAGVGATIGPLGGSDFHTFNIYFMTVVLAFFTWLAWALLSYLIGTRLLGGQARYSDLLRNLGLAYIPGLLMVMLLTSAGQVITSILLAWMAGIGVVATRSAQKTSIVRATLITGVCWVVLIVVMANGLAAIRIID